MIGTLIGKLLGTFRKTPATPPRPPGQQPQAARPIPAPAQPAPAPAQPAPAPAQPVIDWSNKSSPISQYFTVGEALYLPSWGIYHLPTAQEQLDILRMARVMDQIRAFLGKPIRVHCWLRPNTVNCPGSPRHGQDYNRAIGGAPRSAHRLGLAVDFSIKGEDCNHTRTLLEPHLERWGIRMERHRGQWVHVDLYPAASPAARYFNP